MDLTILFTPVDESIYQSITSPSSFYKNIAVFSEKMPSYEGAHMAIFGVGEARGSFNQSECTQAPDEIRKKL